MALPSHLNVGFTAPILAELIYGDNITTGRFAYPIYGGTDYSLNIPKFREHFVKGSLNAAYGIPYNMIPLLTADELLLNRAEAYARIKNYDKGIKDLNTFSAALFNGTYKLITVPGNGPWKSKTDTMTVQLNGNTNIDFPVELYYDLKDIKYQLNGNNLTATFNVEKLDPSKTLDDINLLVGKTKFVDLGHFLKRANKSGDSNGNVTLTVDIGPELQSNPILFARVAAKINGITEAIYDANIHQVK